LKREAKLRGGFYVDPEAKLLFIIRIRGYAFYVYVYLFYVDSDWIGLDAS
jgi:hypothetical protein